MRQAAPRAALLTGRHTARNGMWHLIGWYGYPWARLAEPAFVENLPRGIFTLAHMIHNKVVAPDTLVAKHKARRAPDDGLHNAPASSISTAAWDV